MKYLSAFAMGALCAASFAAGSANAETFKWDGSYVGVQAGGEWAKASGPFTNADGTSPTPYSNKPSGGVIGLRIGHNWQNGNVVLGLEGDLNAALNLKSGSTVKAPPTSYDVETKQSWNGDIRGRLGYATDKTLVYAAGGLAFGDVHTSYGGPGYAPPGGTPFSVTTQRVGWTLGAGAEYAFSDKMIGSIDYRHADLGSRSFSNSDPLINTADKVKFTSNTVVVGLACKF